MLVEAWDGRRTVHGTDCFANARPMAGLVERAKKRGAHRRSRPPKTRFGIEAEIRTGQQSGRAVDRSEQVVAIRRDGRSRSVGMHRIEENGVIG
jgi:hypothetical protein